MEQGLVVAQLNDYPADKYNRLFPTTLTQLSPLHKVMVNVVNIDPDPNKGEVYKQGSAGFSFSKIACLKLMTAANVVMENSEPILPSGCQRCIQVAKMSKIAPQCQGCQTKQDVAYKVSILVPEPSGQHRRYIATKEISREQFTAKNGGTKAPVEHMAAQCETKALLRALRAGLGIKGAYTVGELQKPFAVAVVVLNATDPELKKAMIEKFAAGSNALFGAPAAPQLQVPEFNALPEATSYVADDEYPETIIPEVLPLEGSDDLPGVNDIFTTSLQPEFVCQGCAQVIESTGEWTAESIASFSKRTYGLELCPKCQKVEAAKRKGV